MKAWISLMLLLPSAAFAQGFYTPCLDPNKIVNIYYSCFDDYSPVCGCDGNTYRSPCSAENQHALNAGNFIPGPCGNFHCIVEPNLITYLLELKMYRKTPGYVSVTIYDVYGRIFLQRAFSVPASAGTPIIKEINEVASFQHGMYIIEVISDAERFVYKFYKARY